MPTIRITTTANKPIDQWTNRDILHYYSERLCSSYGATLRIPSNVALCAFQGKVKGFRNKLHLSNAQYKAFIDDVFDLLFEGHGYIPNFGAIISERVYNIISQIHRHGDREALHDIYTNKELARPSSEEMKHVI